MTYICSVLVSCNQHGGHPSGDDLTTLKLFQRKRVSSSPTKLSSVCSSDFSTAGYVNCVPWEQWYPSTMVWSLNNTVFENLLMKLVTSQSIWHHHHFHITFTISGSQSATSRCVLWFPRTCSLIMCHSVWKVVTWHLKPRSVNVGSIWQYLLLRVIVRLNK